MNQQIVKVKVKKAKPSETADAPTVNAAIARTWFGGES